MINAGIKEIKNNLSRYLMHVKEGEDVVITERGKPVARIIMEKRVNKSCRSALSDLIDKGVVTMPTSRINKNKLIPRKVLGRPLSEIVLEDRR